MQCKIAVVCMLIMAGTPVVWANQTAKVAFDELAQPKVKTGMNAIKPDTNTMGWIDKKHQGFQDWLQNSAVEIDGWFGENQSTKPAKASLRVMMDTTWNKYDGIKIKPRVRGRIKLPTLENRLSLVFGDDSLDYETRDGALSDDRTIIPNANDRRYDRRETRENNSSLALRWSKFRRNKDIDIDLGVRSNDVYIRAKAEKNGKCRMILRCVLSKCIVMAHIQNIPLFQRLSSLSHNLSIVIWSVVASCIIPTKERRIFIGTAVYFGAILCLSNMANQS